MTPEDVHTAKTMPSRQDIWHHRPQTTAATTSKGFLSSVVGSKLSRFIHFQHLILLWCTLLVDVTQSIRILNLSVPHHAIKGQDVRMECQFSMDGDKLYSLKWYRNGHEFYRYIPSDASRAQTSIFNRDGIHVDESQSSHTEIVLRSVGLEATGKFKCEVSGEAPSFETDSRIGVLAVVDLPDDGPVITGGFPRYHIGDKVRVNCTSHRSKPAAKLRWYINGEPADQHVTRYKVQKDPDGLETSVLGLRFTVEDEHFEKGDLKLKCTAKIASIYWRSNEESVQGVRTQSALVSQSRSSRNSAFLLLGIIVQHSILALVFRRILLVSD